MAESAFRTCGVLTWVRTWYIPHANRLLSWPTDNLTWSQIKLTTVYRRLSHTATQVGSYLFVWGGHDGTSYTSELLLFNLGTSVDVLFAQSADESG